MEENDLEAYNTLKRDMGVVYNTQICSVIYTNYDPMSGYFLDSWAAKRRERLFNRYVRRKSFLYDLLRWTLRVVGFVVILGSACVISYLLQSELLSIMFGLLAAQVYLLYELMVLDEIRLEIRNELFIRRKRNTN